MSHVLTNIQPLLHHCRNTLGYLRLQNILGHVCYDSTASTFVTEVRHESSRTPWTSSEDGFYLHYTPINTTLTSCDCQFRSSKKSHNILYLSISYAWNSMHGLHQTITVIVDYFIEEKKNQKMFTFKKLESQKCHFFFLILLNKLINSLPK